jgi:hypothetical protein
VSTERTVLKDYSMSKFTFVLRLLAFAAAANSPAVFAASSHDAAGPSVAKASKAQKNGFTSIPSKKGGSGVDVAYRIEGTPTVGSPLTIRIQTASPFNAQTTLRAGEGLLLSDPDQVLQSQAGQRTEHTVTVVPQAEGRFYLNVFSVANNRGGASAIAVHVGKGAVQLKPSGKVQVMPNGERIISVPAQ